MEDRYLLHNNASATKIEDYLDTPLQLDVRINHITSEEVQTGIMIRKSTGFDKLDDILTNIQKLLTSTIIYLQGNDGDKLPPYAIKMSRTHYGHQMQ